MKLACRTPRSTAENGQLPFTSQLFTAMSVVFDVTPAAASALLDTVADTDPVDLPVADSVDTEAGPQSPPLTLLLRGEFEFVSETQAALFGRLGRVFVLAFGFLLPWLSSKWVCTQCGYEWKERRPRR